jgi:hypothetical protein
MEFCGQCVRERLAWREVSIFCRSAKGSVAWERIDNVGCMAIG